MMMKIKVLLINLLFIIFSKRRLFTHTSRKIAILKLDAIGDYILFRNFLESIVNSEKYKDYHVTLIGNEAWKDLAINLDARYVDSFIWINRKRFSKSILYQIKVLLKLRNISFDIVVNGALSREFLLGDLIIGNISAKVKIRANGGGETNISKYFDNFGKRFYSKAITIPSEVEFEFHKNIYFYEQIIESSIFLQKPSVHLNLANKRSATPYVVVFIGGSGASKKWSEDRYATLAKMFRDKYRYDIVLCGGPEDQDGAQVFTKNFPHQFKNLVGKTSLIDLLTILSGAKVLLTNETSAVHLGGSVNVPNIFVLYNGIHYGRFVPYPKDVDINVELISCPEIDQDISKYKIASNKNDAKVIYDINNVTINSAREVIEKEMTPNEQQRQLDTHL